jgi:Spy/CpxP family protein refolding chaperone
MKTRLLITVLLFAGGLFVFSDAFAQRGPGMMQGRGLIFMEELDLTQDQRMEIAEIMARHRAEMRLDRGVRRGGRAGWETAPRAEIMEVLTPEQQNKLNELRAGRQEVQRQFSETYSNTMIERFADDAGIDAAKKAGLLQLTAKQRASMQALRDAEISGEITRTEFRVKAEELRIEHRNEMTKLLTTEEYLMWQDMRQANRPGWNAGNRRWDSPRGTRAGGRRGVQRGNW